MSDLFTINNLGLVAGLLTTIAFVPQLLKTWESKSADDISIGMFSLFIVGVLLWGIYGFEIHSIPVVLANSITFILATSILILKLNFSSNKN